MADKEYLVARAREADQLLNGNVFGQVLAESREQIIRDWENAEDPIEREQCWAALRGLREVQRQLRRVISQGEHASRQPDER